MVKYNVGAGASGATSGAMVGGSIGGPWGALAGGGLGLLGGFGGGGGDRMKKIPTMTKEQTGLLNQMIQMFILKK